MKQKRQQRPAHGLFYPGSIWGKRLFKLMVLSSIGINLFINKLQNDLYQAGDQMLVLSYKLSEPANDIADMTEAYVIPSIKWIRKNRAIGKIEDMGWVTFPNVRNLQDGVRTTRDFKRILEAYGPFYKDVSTILKIMSWFFWIPIGLAALWMFLDVLKGGVLKFNIIALTLVALINYYSYQGLSSSFERVVFHWSAQPSTSLRT